MTFVTYLQYVTFVCSVLYKCSHLLTYLRNLAYTARDILVFNLIFILSLLSSSLLPFYGHALILFLVLAAVVSVVGQMTRTPRVHETSLSDSDAGHVGRGAAVK